jgi:hypothetical protein
MASVTDSDMTVIVGHDGRSNTLLEEQSLPGERQVLKKKRIRLDGGLQPDAFTYNKFIFAPKKARK